LLYFKTAITARQLHSKRKKKMAFLILADEYKKYGDGSEELVWTEKKDKVLPMLTKIEEIKFPELVFIDR